jgi:Holliday junction resolvase RusA-like endonuclease
MRLVVVGLPPTTNNLYAIVGRYQVLTAAGRSYKASLHNAAIATATTPPTNGPVAMMVTYYLRRDRDVDGSAKIVLDALKGVIYEDDRQVDLLVLRKRRTKTLPYLSIVVRRLRAHPVFRPIVERDTHVLATFTDLPPTTNNLYTIFGRRRRKSREARQLQDVYAIGYRMRMGAKSPMRGQVGARIRYGFIANRRDVDGSHKTLIDAASSIVYEDDRQIVRLSLAKGRSAEPIVVAAFYPISA